MTMKWWWCVKLDWLPRHYFYRITYRIDSIWLKEKFVHIKCARFRYASQLISVSIRTKWFHRHDKLLQGFFIFNSNNPKIVLLTLFWLFTPLHLIEMCIFFLKKILIFYAKWCVTISFLLLKTLLLRHLIFRLYQKNIILSKDTQISLGQFENKSSWSRWA